jgi:hypothetical protein
MIVMVFEPGKISMKGAVMRIGILIALLVAASFGAQFFQRTLVLGNTRYIVRIDSTQTLLKSPDSVCAQQKYYYFPWRQKTMPPSYTQLNTPITVIKVASEPGCSLTVSSMNYKRDSLLNCLALNLFPKGSLLTSDTIVITWDYMLLTKNNAVVSLQRIQTSNYYVQFKLRKGKDSVTLTLGKEPHIFGAAIDRGTIVGASKTSGNFDLYSLSGRRITSARPPESPGYFSPGVNRRAPLGAYIAVSKEGVARKMVRVKEW